MIHTLTALAAAAAPDLTPDADPLTKLIAPGGGIAVVLAVVTYIVREWRAGRAIRLEAAVADRDRALLGQKAAEDHAAAVEDERDRIRDDLTEKIDQVREELSSFKEQMRKTLEQVEERHRTESRQQEERHRTEMREQETRHRTEMTRMQALLERETQAGFRYRTFLSGAGIDPDTGRDIAPTTHPDEHGAMTYDQEGP